MLVRAYSSLKKKLPHWAQPYLVAHWLFYSMLEGRNEETEWLFLHPLEGRKT